MGLVLFLIGNDFLSEMYHLLQYSPTEVNVRMI